MFGHFIKFVCEDFDLVATLYIEPKVQVTSTYTCRAFTECFKRTYYTTRYEQARKESHNETDQKDRRGAKHGLIERLISFLCRLLNDNSPTQSWNEYERAENLIA